MAITNLLLSLCWSRRWRCPLSPTSSRSTSKRHAGLDVIEGNCASCHSLDYVQMNSPFLNAAGWDAEVTKMIKFFGAPISDADAKTIADYLKANYGG